MIVIAHDAGIPVEGMYAHGDDVSASTTGLRDKIARIKSSVAWVWYDALEADRPRLRQAIVETLGRFKM